MLSLFAFILFNFQQGGMPYGGPVPKVFLYPSMNGFLNEHGGPGWGKFTPLLVTPVGRTMAELGTPLGDVTNAPKGDPYIGVMEQPVKVLDGPVDEIGKTMQLYLSSSSYAGRLGTYTGPDMMVHGNKYMIVSQLGEPHKLLRDIYDRCALSVVGNNPARIWGFFKTPLSHFDRAHGKPYMFFTMVDTIKYGTPNEVALVDTYLMSDNPEFPRVGTTFGYQPTKYTKYVDEVANTCRLVPRATLYIIENTWGLLYTEQKLIDALYDCRHVPNAFSDPFQPLEITQNTVPGQHGVPQNLIWPKSEYSLIQYVKLLSQVRSTRLRAFLCRQLNFFLPDEVSSVIQLLNDPSAKVRKSIIIALVNAFNDGAHQVKETDGTKMLTKRLPNGNIEYYTEVLTNLPEVIAYWKAKLEAFAKGDVSSAGIKISK